MSVSDFAFRQPELAELLQGIARPGAFVVVEGEPGAGRSTLLGQVRPDDRLVLPARCVRLSRPAPLGPVIEAVSTAIDRWTAMADRLPPLAGALRPLLPELALPDLGDLGRHQTFRALRALLTLHERTVLVLDDVHEAEEETHDFLRYLASTPAPGLAVVASSAPRPRTPGRWWVPRDGVTARVVLKPLPATRIPAPDAAAVLERTGGVADAVRAVLAGGDETAWREVVASRVADLGAERAAVVEALAVLGGPASGEALAAVAQVTCAADAVLASMDAGLLIEQGPGRYAMRSPLVADAVYASIPGPRRCLLHLRAAHLLAAAAEPDATAVARQHRAAGDFAEGARWTAVAVDAATGKGQPGEAVLLLEAALRDPDLPRAAREEFAVRLSRELAFGLADEGTVGLLRAAVLDWPLSRTARGEIRLNLGRLLINQSVQVDAGRSEIELAVADLAHRRALLARGLASLALPHAGAVPVEENLRWLGKAEAAIAGISDVEVIAAVTANRLSGRMQLADPGVWQEVDRLPRSPRQAEVRRQVCRAYVNVADAAAWNGHYTRARACLAAARRLIRDEHQPYLEALATGTELRVDVAMGLLGEVETEARHLIERVGQASSLAAEPLLVLGWHDLGRGHRAAAQRHFDAAFAIGAGSAPLQASAFAGRVAVHLAAKDLAAARRLADDGVETVRRKNNWIWAAELMPYAVRVLLAQDELCLAEELTADTTRASRDAMPRSPTPLICFAMACWPRRRTTSLAPPNCSVAPARLTKRSRDRMPRPVRKNSPASASPRSASTRGRRWR
ncbi:AAA ATPase domain-containing protein [Amycolatopsis xylanica]|uniref:AAA ATPase domain-containing protein n=1 Tax=Amycolatopsis xylanica TaxID=589385 RepID=A0A1H2UBE4_9PSEU|nr:AAA family ATPase [Amycolatopsis xylanica]SDW53218.1 AAA ATPase domain-containing protein [Amycolatopsis xylanica]